MLDGIVEDWITPVAEMTIRQGLPTRLARAQARLGVAVTRGLLLDLLATGDREEVDEAMELFLDWYGTQLATQLALHGPIEAVDFASTQGQGSSQRAGQA